MDVKMGKVINSGNVTVVKPFNISWFDEDDGWMKQTVKPGTYEYRVMDVRGWKPRQLKIDGEWMDVNDNCEELETLLSEVQETTTISNIAPTVDYLGHVMPVAPVKPEDVAPDSKNLEPKDDPLKNKNWVSPLGRLLAGESVRTVVLSSLNEDSFNPDSHYNAQLQNYLDKTADAQEVQAFYDEKMEEYNEKVNEFKHATRSVSDFNSYAGDFTVFSELEYSKEDSDDHSDSYFFIVRDEDLDEYIENMSILFNKANVPFNSRGYFIYVFVNTDKNVGIQPVKNLVNEYNKNGKSAKTLLSEIQKFPFVQDVMFDWDSDSL